MLWYELERFGRFWDPWREFERMSKAMSRLAEPYTVEFPAVNVWVSGDHAVVTTELQGIEPDEIDIAVVENVLTLRGIRKQDDLNKGESYHRRERWRGQFSKSVSIPFKIAPDKIEAKYSRGILSVSVPRAEVEKPRKITITS